MNTRQPSRPAEPDDALAARMAKAERSARRQVQTLVGRTQRPAAAQDRLVAVGALDRALVAERETLALARDAAIRERRAEGASWADVARELGVSITRVQQIRAARQLG